MVFASDSDSDSHCDPIFEGDKSSDTRNPAMGVIRVVVQSAHVHQRSQFQSRPKPFVSMWISDATSETSLPSISSESGKKPYIRTCAF